jgi:uncharacterized protein (TIGR02453 family)
MSPARKIAPPSEFSGFSEEAFRFLRGLKKNNNRDWFLSRKAIFEEQLQAPMTLLMRAIESEMKKNKVPLLAKPKAILSRISRDVRFSANKDPYHNFLSGTLVRNGRKGAPGVLYVHIDDKEPFAAVGFWQPERTVLTNWRLRMQAEPQPFLGLVQQLENKKLALAEEHRLQRMPRGFTAADGSPIAEYLRFESFVLVRPITKAETMSAELPYLVTRFVLDAKPLLDYGWAIPVREPAVFVD